jgi:hypothetical protein
MIVWKHIRKNPASTMMVLRALSVDGKQGIKFEVVSKLKTLTPPKTFTQVN